MGEIGFGKETANMESKEQKITPLWLNMMPVLGDYVLYQRMLNLDLERRLFIQFGRTALYH